MPPQPRGAQAKSPGFMVGVGCGLQTGTRRLAFDTFAAITYYLLDINYQLLIITYYLLFITYYILTGYIIFIKGSRKGFLEKVSRKRDARPSDMPPRLPERVPERVSGKKVPGKGSRKGFPTKSIITKTSI